MSLLPILESLDHSVGIGYVLDRAVIALTTIDMQPQAVVSLPSSPSSRLVRLIANDSLFSTECVHGPYEIYPSH